MALRPSRCYNPLRPRMRVASSPVLPLALDPSRPEPLYGQLYAWFHRAIISGQLSPGQRLPSTRELAAELGVSRVPVLQAFDQLKAEGYLQARVGSGTRVSRAIPPHSVGKSAPAAAPTLTGGARSIAAAATHEPQRVPWLRVTGAFRLHVPALDHFPIGVWSRLVARHARARSGDVMAYGSWSGYAPFCSALARYLRTVRGVRCEAQQVMVVSGSQQALFLCARVLANPGDAVWVEEPGYSGARGAFAAAGLRLVPVAVDSQGLDVRQGMRRSPTARVAYVTPSHQFPLGATMSAARRTQLLGWAARAGAWIIEDDFDSEYRQGARPIAALQGLDSDARVIYVGTFSKALFPALRVGYMVVPPDLVDAFSGARSAMDVFPPTLYQAVLADFIEEGHFARHVRRMQMLYEERCKLLEEALSAELGSVLEIANGKAGTHLVALLPRGLRDTAVSARAAALGVSAVPLSSCCLKPAARGGLVLGYGAVDEAQIRQGVRTLRQCIVGE
jgi:GntR family transcriptional regulator / MocR family aminotransferase